MLAEQNCRLELFCWHSSRKKWTSFERKFIIGIVFKIKGTQINLKWNDSLWSVRLKSKPCNAYRILHSLLHPSSCSSIWDFIGKKAFFPVDALGGGEEGRPFLKKSIWKNSNHKVKPLPFTNLKKNLDNCNKAKIIEI